MFQWFNLSGELHDSKLAIRTPYCLTKKTNNIPFPLTLEISPAEILWVCMYYLSDVKF